MLLLWNVYNLKQQFEKLISSESSVIYNIYEQGPFNTIVSMYITFHKQHNLLSQL